MFSLIDNHCCLLVLQCFDWGDVRGGLIEHILKHLVALILTVEISSSCMYSTNEHLTYQSF